MTNLTCTQVSEGEFTCTQIPLSPNQSCYGWDERAGIGFTTAALLTWGGLYIPTRIAQRAYKDLTHVNEDGVTIWAGLDGWGKVKSVGEPLLLSLGGLSLAAAGFGFGYFSYSETQKCWNAQ